MHNLFSETAMESWRGKCPSLNAYSVADQASIYRQGDQCTDVFGVCDGIVRLSRLTVEGAELTMALLKSGELFGCLQPEAVTNVVAESAYAVGDARICRIAHEDFKVLLSCYPTFSASVLTILWDRNQRAEGKLQAILTQTVEAHVVGTLRELAQLFGLRCAHGYALEIRLTQQNLADLVGASRSVVSTVMNQLRSRGLLDYTRDLICVNDVALSEDYAGV